MTRPKQRLSTAPADEREAADRVDAAAHRDLAIGPCDADYGRPTSEGEVGEMHATHVTHTSTPASSLASSRRWTVRAVVAESHRGWKVCAALAGVIALLCSVDHRIPVASGVALAALLPAVLVDLIEGRLPNRLVALAALAGTVALAIEIVARSTVTAPSAALIGAATMAGPLLIAHLIEPEAMGFGDVKAALVAGAALGLVDPILGLAALAMGSAATAIIGVATRRRSIVFGPGLVGGAIAALVLVASPIVAFGALG